MPKKSIAILFLLTLSSSAFASGVPDVFQLFFFGTVAGLAIGLATYGIFTLGIYIFCRSKRCLITKSQANFSILAAVLIPVIFISFMLGSVILAFVIALPFLAISWPLARCYLSVLGFLGVIKQVEPS